MACSQPALAQTLAHGSDAEIPYARVGAALVLCLALAAGAAWAMRSRFGRATKMPALADWLAFAPSIGAGAPARRLTLVERLRVNPQLEICLLSCEGRRYLVAASPTGALLLDKDPPTTAGEKDGL